MKKYKLMIIANPKSGTGGKAQILQDFGRIINHSRFDLRTEYTRYAGHASVLAAMAAENRFDAVVAVGGDGTVNEVARSLIGTQTALAIIPCGSGNGLARHLDIPLEHTEAIALINRMEVHDLDYGIVNGRPFFCTCGMGFDATVSHKFAASLHRGILTYMEQTVREIMRYKPEVYTIEADGKVSTIKAFVMTICNASQYGNNAYIASSASMKDGLMDITIVEPFPALQAPQLAVNLFNGTLDTNSCVKTMRAKRVRITREREGAAIHIDGEPLVGPRVTDIEIVSRQLRVVVNPDARHHPVPLRETIGKALGFKFPIKPINWKGWK